LATFFLLLVLFPLFGLKSALLPRWASRGSILIR
jgi:hypothetical protein